MNEQLSPKGVEEILNRRADKAAQAKQGGDNRGLISTVAVVGVGKERFGIPMEGLSVISRTPPVAHLPKLPPSIRGVVQIRGELIGAIDMARWFGIDTKTKGHLLAVVEGPPGKLGLLIDSVLGFRDVAAGDIVETFCDDTQSTGHPVQATTKDLIAILSLEQLFRCPEVGVDYTGARQEREITQAGNKNRDIEKEHTK